MRWTHCLLAALLWGCSSGGGDGAPPGGDPFGLTARITVNGLTFPTGTPQPQPLNEVVAFRNLTFDRPLFLTFPPDGSDRIFVVEQGGDIYVFTNDPDATVGQRQLFLSLAVSRAGNEEGLLGFAFDPNFAANRRFFVYYSLASPRRSRLSSFLVDAADPDAADPTSETILFEFTQPFSNHNGGSLAFGPDGMLYVASGDGGSGGDPQNNAQNLDNLLGKILRVNPDGTAPTDNPFYTTADADRSKIWAYGLRNPWRMSFDRVTGDLWVGDVGQGDVEEIDIVTRGGNYGWRFFEGERTFNNPTGIPFSNFDAPIVTYSHNLGVSVTGGYVYRGPTLASMAGVYIYGDFASGRVWALVHDQGRLVSNTQVATMGSIASFGEDQAGELYVCSFDGRIYRFEEQGGGPGDVPETLSATGLFSNVAALTPTPGLIEYDVNAPLWSDGARKRRWIALPGSQRITFRPTDAWTFPVGTVLVKHFEIDVVGGGTRRLETRVLVFTESGWQGYTYRWNAQQSDANLIDDAETEVITVPDAVLGQVDLTWYYPSRGDCLSCHTQASGRVLGIRTRQLNRDFRYPAVTDNQLRSWNNISLFTTTLADHSQYEALADPADTTASLAERARSYLAANCAQCHLPNGPTPVNLDLRYGIPAAQMNALNVPGTTGLSAIPSSLRIDPGFPATSIVVELMGRLGNGRMPTLASNRVDRDGQTVVSDWIGAGAPD